MILGSTLVSALTPPFTIQKGFLRPNSIEGNRLDREIGRLFQNPAGISQARKIQFNLESSQDFFGYDFVQAAYLIPGPVLNVAFGLASFQASDISRVTGVGATKPTILGQFAHKNEVYNLSLGKMIFPGLSVGTAVQLYRQQLDNDSSRSFSVDTGFLWDIHPQLWVGAYSRNWISTAFEWVGSNASERLDRHIISEAGILALGSQLIFLSDFSENHRVFGELAVVPSFSLIGDAVWGDKFSFRRYGLGAILDLTTVTIQYLHLSVAEVGLGSDQDQLGLLLRF
ncbi:MAG: hypothetical protein ACI9BD_000223 [Candidatus Marinamargulisbacteria bacterium]|jgi:hypothetical protein